MSLQRQLWPNSYHRPRFPQHATFSDAYSLLFQTEHTCHAQMVDGMLKAKSFREAITQARLLQLFHLVTPGQ